MSNYVADKVIIVTGAASGFGRLVSQKTAAMGAHLVCADIDEAQLDETKRDIAAAGGSVDSLVTDVTQGDQMKALASRACERFGSIDVLINNAGVMPLAFFADHEQAAPAWERCIDINIKGVINGIVAVYDQMIAQGHGHIVNLSSIYGNFPVVGAGVYGATKAAVNFLSESLRVESQGKIKVTIVKPTGVPATGLGAGIINPEAIVGILGHNAPDYLQMMQAHIADELPAEYSDPDSIEYYALEPDALADQIVYAINQPWGVSIGDITVRASGDGYVL
jgi:NADP-dependent 3-hydroxy acid dehydrogenase YdfG